MMTRNNASGSPFDSLRRFLRDRFDLGEDSALQDEVVDNICRGVDFRGTNLWVLIFATFVASLGLNVNSTAVIIGAMLISPLMGPIMGMGLSVGINDFDLLKRSVRNFGFMVLVSILTSTLYFVVSPLSGAQSELLARTVPTTYDVLIAFFGGLAGIVAQSRRDRTSTVIPGVAIATALMPPLCTAGFGLATGNFYYFFGAFYLFFINSVFIAFATTLGVKLMKYSKKEFVDDERRKKVERMVYTILILTMAPSIYLTYNMVKENFFEVAASRFVSQNFNYADTQVLSKSAVTEHGKRIIRVSLVGAEIPKDSIAVAQARLPQYGLGGAILEVRQGYGQNQADISTLSSAMFKDIYLHNQEQIARQQKTIDSLENLASHYQQYDSVGVEVAPEIKVLFPNVTDIAISKTIFSCIDTEARDTTTLAVVRHSKVFSLSEQKRFKEWLQARLGTKKVQLVIEK